MRGTEAQRHRGTQGRMVSAGGRDRGGLLRFGPLSLRAFVPLCLLLLLLLPSPTHAQLDQTHPDYERIHELHSKVAGAFGRQDIPAAEAALAQLVELEPGNFVNWYNYACVHALNDRLDEAAQCLMRAVERGFIDVNHMTSDRNLKALHDHPDYLRIVGNWDTLVEANVDANLEAVQRQYDPRRYEIEKDPELRLAYYSAFDPESFRVARMEIERIAAWADEHVFGNVNDEAFLEDKPWVVVVLPTRRDFRRWAASVYGEAAINATSQIGGSYTHDKNRLVAQDLGSSLRHEFFHVMHWRDNMHHRQGHPVWVQEGLCSLIEDYDVKDGDLVPAASWRTNSAVRLARNRGLLHLKELAETPRGRFTGFRPLAHYAQARTVFLYLYRMGKLKAWYETYRETFNEDPTGIRAMEIVFGLPIDEINEQYAEWVRMLPEVPEWNRMPDGFVAIGVEVNPGSGDGPVVDHVSGRSAYDAGLRRRDVITAIEGRPTRDVHELLRVLNDYRPGDVVEITYRRRNRTETASVRLIERR